MAIINLPFNNSVNDCLQVGDTLYSCSPSATGQFNFVDTVQGIVNIGTCHSIDLSTNVVQVDSGSLSYVLPTSTSFILFSKDNQVNLSSLIGYYAEVKLVNNSKQEAELYSVGIDVVSSSK